MPIDPVRFCVLTTVALIAWLVGPPVCVMLMSALGIWAYARAMRAGLQETKCFLKRPVLAMSYLAVAFIAAAGFIVRQQLR